MNSLFPDVIASWNLFMDIFNYKVVPSLDLLKNDIISLIRPESKSFFNIHDPTRLRYLFQLRFIYLFIYLFIFYFRLVIIQMKK